MPIRFSTYTRGTNVPDLPGNSLFHSTALFRVYEKTSGYRPIMLVAYDGDRPIAKMLAVIRKSVRWFPPSVIHRCVIYDGIAQLSPHNGRQCGPLKRRI